MSENLIYKIAISSISNVGPVTARKLIAYAGSIEAVFKENKRNLTRIPGIGEYVASKICSSKIMHLAEKELSFIHKNSITPVYYLDTNYPKRLKHCVDAPMLIYLKGIKYADDIKIISVVGTRNPTDHGLENCKKLIEKLAVNFPDLCIVSGLAYGIDSCAHTAALENDLKTIAVLGHGLQMIYPSIHKSLSEKITQNGLLISEYPSFYKYDKSNFVRRNRIIAGISDATIVVESANKGGSLITADIAHSYNRDVFAFPGRPGDIKSEGCNNLIKTNKAAMICHAGDLEYFLGWEKRKASEPIQQQIFQELTDVEKQVINHLDAEISRSLNEIARLTKISVSRLAAILLDLEFKGVLVALPGNAFKLKTKLFL